MCILSIFCFDNSMKNEPSAHNRKMLVHDAMPRRVQFMAPSRVYAFSSWSQWWQKPNDPSEQSTLHIFLQSQLIETNINENKKKKQYIAYEKYKVTIREKRNRSKEKVMCGNEKHQLKTIVINTRDNKEIDEFLRSKRRNWYPKMKET